MRSSESFTLEYVPPGIARCGRYDMTDFGVIYEDSLVTYYFSGKGIWESDVFVGYEICLPKELTRIEPGAARDVWERVREYALEQNPLNWFHENLSMRPFAEVWAERECDSGP